MCTVTAEALLRLCLVGGGNKQHAFTSVYCFSLTIRCILFEDGVQSTVKALINAMCLIPGGTSQVGYTTNWQQV